MTRPAPETVVWDMITSWQHQVARRALHRVATEPLEEYERAWLLGAAGGDWTAAVECMARGYL